jgi:hypothetical protein
MRLENHLGIIADPATIESLGPAVNELTDVDEAYIILSFDVEQYVQVAGTVAENFIIERRDGCAGEHYRGDRRVSADELVVMLEGYLRSAPDWSHGLTWHQVDVGEDAPRA